MTTLPWGGCAIVLRRATGLRRASALAASLAVVVATVGCSTGSDSERQSANVGTTVATPASRTETSASAGTGAPTSDVDSVPSSIERDGLPAGFELSPHSAPATSAVTALLHDVRVGSHDRFERIVFEFEGVGLPEYRIRWSSGPIRTDGSGEVVDLAGPAHLEMVFTPASGVDFEDGMPIYTGPDRVSVPKGSGLLTDLVRTGDFEAQLSWVAGASQEVPFRVLSLSTPSRIAVDLLIDDGA